MDQKSYRSRLGEDLRSARRTAGQTQAALAGRVRVSLPTVRTAERGQGLLATYMSLADGLDMEIGGRPLPPGASLGERLAAVRRRRRIGRRILARMANVSPTTVAAIERTSGGQVASMARIAAALGVHLRLVPRGAGASYWADTATSSAHHGWETPPEVLERLYRVVDGRFGLDPCAAARRGPRANVRARVRFTAEDDGLTLPWIAPSVFVNPPYGRSLAAWVAKAREEARSGRAGVVIALVPARPDTKWWFQHIADIADVWLLRGRLAFGDGSRPAPFPSALIGWSASDEHRARMRVEFPKAWHIPAKPPPPAGERELAAD